MRCTPRLQFKIGAPRNRARKISRANLELQAQIDTYLVLLLFVAFFRKTQRFRAPIAAGCAFIYSNPKRPAGFAMKICGSGILETTELAANYTRLSRFA